MIYTLIISSAPFSSSSSSHNALHFAKALLLAGHSIKRLFFYGEGVYNLNGHAITPQGEHDICADWAKFIEEFALDSVVCIAAAARRGILDKTEAARHSKQGETLKGNSELSGLGQLIDAASDSDRVLTFG